MIRYYDFRAMNSDILLAAEGVAARVTEGFKEVQGFISGCEKRFSRFSDQSELTRLNLSSGTWVHVSDDLFSLLFESRSLFEMTNGLFDPSILEALEFAGYDRNLEKVQEGQQNSYIKIKLTPQTIGFQEVRFDRNNQSVRLPTGMRIDLGGIAKGWAAEKAAGLLASYADACAVSAGGDLYVIGLPEGKTNWQVGLEDPNNPNRTLAILKLSSHCGVATSSTTKRKWTKDNRIAHQLIDPRTGSPAITDWMSVTVIAPHTTIAEAYAKSFLIAGSHQAKGIISRTNQIAVIAVDAYGKLWSSPRSKEFIDGDY